MDDATSLPDARGQPIGGSAEPGLDGVSLGAPPSSPEKGASPPEPQATVAADNPAQSDPQDPSDPNPLATIFARRKPRASMAAAQSSTSPSPAPQAAPLNEAKSVVDPASTEFKAPTADTSPANLASPARTTASDNTPAATDQPQAEQVQQAAFDPDAVGASKKRRGQNALERLAKWIEPAIAASASPDYKEKQALPQQDAPAVLSAAVETAASRPAVSKPLSRRETAAPGAAGFSSWSSLGKGGEASDRSTRGNQEGEAPRKSGKQQPQGRKVAQANKATPRSKAKMAAERPAVLPQGADPAPPPSLAPYPARPARDVARVKDNPQASGSIVGPPLEVRPAVLPRSPDNVPGGFAKWDVPSPSTPALAPSGPMPVKELTGLSSAAAVVGGDKGPAPIVAPETDIALTPTALPVLPASEPDTLAAVEKDVPSPALAVGEAKAKRAPLKRKRHLFERLTRWIDPMSNEEQAEPVAGPPSDGSPEETSIQTVPLEKTGSQTPAASLLPPGAAGFQSWTARGANPSQQSDFNLSDPAKGQPTATRKGRPRSARRAKGASVPLDHVFTMVKKPAAGPRPTETAVLAPYPARPAQTPKLKDDSSKATSAPTEPQSSLRSSVPPLPPREVPGGFANWRLPVSSPASVDSGIVPTGAALAIEGTELRVSATEPADNRPVPEPVTALAEAPSGQDMPAGFARWNVAAGLVNPPIASLALERISTSAQPATAQSEVPGGFAKWDLLGARSRSFQQSLQTQTVTVVTPAPPLREADRLEVAIPARHDMEIPGGFARWNQIGAGFSRQQPARASASMSEPAVVTNGPFMPVQASGAGSLGGASETAPPAPAEQWATPGGFARWKVLEATQASMALGRFPYRTQR